MPTTYSLVGPHLKVARSATDFDLYDLRVNTKISDVAEVVTITLGQSNKKFEIPYASFDPALSGSGAFMTLFNAQVAKNMASVAWGYDSVTGDSVLIKTGTDGITTYESPIGNAYTPTGTIYPIQRKARNFSGLFSTLVTGAGSTTAGAHRVVFSWDNSGTPTINGILQISSGGSGFIIQKVFDAEILGDGQYVGLPSISYDGSITPIVIDELFL